MEMIDSSTEIKDHASWDDFYHGSRKFQFLADSSGLPMDQINYLLCQLFSLLLAYIFRVFLHSKIVSSTSRHLAALSAGLLISYFCFGKQVLLAVLLTVMCYCILAICPTSSSHHVTLFVSLSFLSITHILRQIYEDGIFVIDVTGPLMIMVQKVTSLAYSLHDGTKEEEELTELQQKFVIREKPSLLEYFSYLLCFQSILAGPYFMFTDYKDFIEGNHYIKIKTLNKKKLEELSFVDSNGNTSPMNLSAKISYKEPSPTQAVINKTLISVFCASLVLFVCRRVPISRLSESVFFTWSFPKRFGYIILATTLSRPLYYTGWYLADAICNMSGLGFSGYDKQGNPNWDLVTNVDLFGVEFGTSLKSTLESWNSGTMQWFRFLVYERAPVQKTVLTYLLSSLWHGFYPGYYFAFLGGAFFTICARTIRRRIRHRIVDRGSFYQFCYNIVTWIVTRACLAYMTFPFVLLRFWQSLRVYYSLFFFMHVLALSLALLLPRILSSSGSRSAASPKTVKTE